MLLYHLFLLLLPVAVTFCDAGTTAFPLSKPVSTAVFTRFAFIHGVPDNSLHVQLNASFTHAFNGLATRVPSRIIPNGQWQLLNRPIYEFAWSVGVGHNPGGESVDITCRVWYQPSRNIWQKGIKVIEVVKDPNEEWQNSEGWNTPFIMWEA